MQLERKIRLLTLADPSFQNIGQDLSRTYMMLLGGSYYGQRLTEVCSNLHYAPDLFADCSFMCREHYRVRNTEAYDSASYSAERVDGEQFDDAGYVSPMTEGKS